MPGVEHDTNPKSLLELFAAELEARSGVSAIPDPDQFAEELAALWRRARAAWPDFSPGPDLFVAHLARHLPANTGTHAALAQVHAEDLYLALACGAGDAAALAAFGRRHAEDLRLAVARVRGSAESADDVRQAVESRLFVRTPDAAPKILDYSGQGQLRNWFRVALVRALLDEQRRRRGEPEPADDAHFLGVAAPERDPELEYLRRLYTHEFREAFEQAAKSLDAEDKNALRAHYVSQLTVDQIAAMFGIHRATAARRVASARDRLLAETRRRLMARLKLSRAELESVMRLIESRLDVSVHRVLV